MQMANKHIKIGSLSLVTKEMQSKSQWWAGGGGGDFPGGAMVKNLPANTGDTGSSPGPERSHMPRSN